MAEKIAFKNGHVAHRVPMKQQGQEEKKGKKTRKRLKGDELFCLQFSKYQKIAPAVVILGFRAISRRNRAPRLLGRAP